jgi:hypothetical protein
VVAAPVPLRLLGIALEESGFDVRAATDGESGFSLLRLVRHAGGERDLGLVLLGSATDDATRAELLSLGASAPRGLNVSGPAGVP